MGSFYYKFNKGGENKMTENKKETALEEQSRIDINKYSWNKAEQCVININKCSWNQTN